MSDDSELSGMEKKRGMVQKARSRADKIGKYKYLQQLQKRTLRELESVKKTQRMIVSGLRSLFQFDKAFIQDTVCVDELDRAILQCLYEEGEKGLFPRQVAARLKQYKTRRQYVSRRLVKMNRRLDREIGETVAQKQGYRWVLTDFAFSVWGQTEEEVEESGVEV